MILAVVLKKLGRILESPVCYIRIIQMCENQSHKTFINPFIIICLFNSGYKILLKIVNY